MRTTFRFLMGVTALTMASGCVKKPDPAPAAAPATVASETSVEMASYQELGEFFKTYGFTYEGWQVGFRAVPRAYVSDVPKRWVETTKSVSLNQKKKIFYSALLPIVLRANEKIVTDRRNLESLAMRIFADQTISEDDRTYLADLAARYKVDTTSGTDARTWVPELLNRVDEIPPALALAQASYESAFATSRFAGEGNALFGQFAYSGNRMKSRDPREKGWEYQIAAFDRLLDTVSAYAFNLNTHRAYKQFRKLRAKYRQNGQAPDATALAATLLDYSTRREAYTRELARIIRSHGLSRADSAYLEDMTPIHIIPKQDSSETK